MNFDEKLVEILKGKFDYEQSPICATPSGNYFWYRKRQEVIKLFKRNLHLFDLNQTEKSAPYLFVDVGCGESIDLFLIRQFLEKHSSGWRLIGLEAEPTALEVANLKKKYYNVDNVDIIACDVTKNLPFKDGEVNVVYCSEVIEHLIDPELFIKEIKRITKPNGYLIITTPNEPNVFQGAYWSRNRLDRMRAEMQAMKEQSQKVNIETENVFLHGHVSLKTISEWDNTLEKIGFKIVDRGRGAVTYGATPFYDNAWILGGRFLLEAFLDLLPRQWVCNLSDQLIGLYRLEK
ncbi:class I SAM-dependent methyltransferase [Planktothrix sp. FACHB-1355]|uniref:Class I SAM-dependent methyltransferase n=2 Tax=Oscillatoriophycideae TaxID=1301283 RepID=A0A926VA80_9CYAN|nr:class I SAM-dependent methyltransferase [Aerosakkonema funiforme]MBD2179805.1 class I SAM-dependent methyltransferase [Aerosakkonema funiforme FACHB-1375]MBD3563454.1 class I SAM-dependent methyltransferase [Planktothrix sp. FACHB-1355]